MAGNFARVLHDGDDRERLTCRDCGYVAYENPKVVVGSVVEVDGGVMLCRRAIEPRSGYWTLPAGYMELGETVEEGARREAREEAGADIALHGILGVFSIARLGQVQVMFRAALATPGYAPGPESLDVRVFRWGDIPWEEIAFPSVRWSLDAWHAGLGHPGPPVGNPPEDARGTRPLQGAAEIAG